MSSTSLMARLTSLTEARKTTHALITRLSRLPCQPGTDNGDVRTELSAEIHQRLKEQEEELDLLRQEVDDFLVGRNREKEAEKARLEVGVQRLGEDLRLARTHFRKAQLQAKRNAELARQKERELLFAGAGAQQDGEGPLAPTRTQRKPRGGPVSQDELLVNASEDVTAALRRTHQLLQSELSRSQFAHDTLQQSTEALQTLSESYSNLSTLLASSRSLLSTLLRSQKSDTWYLETAFYILVSTIVWLIFRRFFYGPLWWFLWLPLKLSFRASWAILATLGSVRFGTRSTPSSAAPDTLILEPSATRAFPTTWKMTDNATPSLVVDGGKAGSEEEQQQQQQQQGTLSSQSDPSSMVERVGRMISTTTMMTTDDTQSQQGSEQQQQQQQQQQPAKGGSAAGNDGAGARPDPLPRNVKKRMWEEDREAKKHDERMMMKDEL